MANDASDEVKTSVEFNNNDGLKLIRLRRGLGFLWKGCGVVVFAGKPFPKQSQMSSETRSLRCQLLPENDTTSDRHTANLASTLGYGRLWEDELRDARYRFAKAAARNIGWYQVTISEMQHAGQSRYQILHRLDCQTFDISTSLTTDSSQQNGLPRYTVNLVRALLVMTI